MRLCVLGMNGPFPEPGCGTSGYLLTGDTGRVVFDLGSGTLARLTGLTPPEILDGIFFSHWHYDHCSDALPLLYRLQALGVRLPVWGPVDEGSAVRAVLKKDPGIELHDVAPGDTVCAGGFEISVYPAVHPVPSVMYRVRENGKVFCYTGDTNQQDALPGFVKDADFLLADGLFTDETWSAGKPHLSARMCAELARDGQVRKLLLTHFNPLIDRAELLRQAREAYPTVMLAECGAQYEVG